MYFENEFTLKIDKKKKKIIYTSKLFYVLQILILLIFN